MGRGVSVRGLQALAMSDCARLGIRAARATDLDHEGHPAASLRPSACGFSIRSPAAILLLSRGPDGYAAAPAIASDSLSNTCEASARIWARRV